ncbi:MAG: ABC transporter permease [Actinomycetota bacterium]|nr:ABC transporter permease [Actinomycetota bacterium]MDQ3719215.1 ABC transporter permease [Actinomycetota bacterium]
MSANAGIARAYRIRGPAAVSGDPRRFWHLVTTLAYNDWKLRFFGSVLGYVWSLLRPLMLFAILYVVFSHVIRIGGDVENYPVQLLVGVVLFTYFTDVAGGAVESLVDSEPLVRKVAFPRMVIPLAVAMTATFTLALNLLTVGVFLVVAGIEPRVEWLLLVVPLVLLMALGAGAAMLLSALYVPFRDVRPIWDVVQQALFYATPIFYPIEIVIGQSDTLAKVAMCNPLALIVQWVRHILLGPPTPSPSEVLGGTAVVAPLVALAAVAVVGYAVFSRMAPSVAERL